MLHYNKLSGDYTVLSELQLFNFCSVYVHQQADVLECVNS